MQKITIEHQCSVDVNGADVASCLGHDMEKLIQFISDIDMALSDIEFPRAVLRWAQAAIESEAT